MLLSGEGFEASSFCPWTELLEHRKKMDKRDKSDNNWKDAKRTKKTENVGQRAKNEIKGAMETRTKRKEETKGIRKNDKRDITFFTTLFAIVQIVGINCFITGNRFYFGYTILSSILPSILLSILSFITPSFLFSLIPLSYLLSYNFPSYLKLSFLPYPYFLFHPTIEFRNNLFWPSFLFSLIPLSYLLSHNFPSYLKLSSLPSHYVLFHLTNEFRINLFWPFKFQAYYSCPWFISIAERLGTNIFQVRRNGLL